MRLTRSVILFSAGLSGLIYEILAPGPNSEVVVTACVAILLAPGVLYDDERRRQRRRRDDEPDR